MKAHEYLVTTSIDGRSRKTIWNPEKPLNLDHPIRWVLENSPEGLRVRDRHGNLIEITERLMQEGAAVDLPSQSNSLTGKTGQSTQLQIQPLQPLRAAYLPPRVQPGAVPDIHASVGPGRLFASFGVKKILLEYHPILDAFAGKVRRKPIFSFYTSPDGGHQLKALMTGVRIKVQGERSQTIEKGKVIAVNEAMLSNITLIWGFHWWRINRVVAPEIPLIDESLPEDLLEENRRFKMLAAGILGFFVFASLMVILFVKTGVLPAEAVPPLAESIKILLKKPVLTRGSAPDDLQAHQTSEVLKEVASKFDSGRSVQQKTHAQEAAAQAEARTQAQIQVQTQALAKAHPEPAEAPVPTVAKSKPISKAGNPGKNRVAAASALAKASQAKAAAAQNALAEARMLRASLANVLTSKNPDQDTHLRAAVAGNAGATDEVFKGAGSGGNSATTGTENANLALGAGAGTSLGSVKVANAGGASNRGVSVGYSSGEHAKVNNQGRGFLAPDPKEVLISKGLTMDEVGAVIHAHRAEAKFCHDSALIGRPGLEGKVQIAFTISPGGRVKTTHIEESTMNESSMEACVTDALKKWQFPKPKGGVEVSVTYPFYFKVLDVQ